MTQVSDTLASKFVHTVLIVLIVVYVVFVKKSCSTVESVLQPVKTIHAPTYAGSPLELVETSSEGSAHAMRGADLHQCKNHLSTILSGDPLCERTI